MCTASPAAAARSIPAWNRSPRGPYLPLRRAASGQASLGGTIRCSVRTAAIVAGPAMPSGHRPAQRWNRFNAPVRCGPNAPSNTPDGKPRHASSNCSSATSPPTAPSSRTRGPEPGAALPEPRGARGQTRERLLPSSGRGCRRSSRGTSPRGAERPEARPPLDRLWRRLAPVRSPQAPRPAPGEGTERRARTPFVRCVREPPSFSFQGRAASSSAAGSVSANS